ncbi:type I restriction-modification system subunit M [Xanthomonas euvesicatoria pv. physalidis]|uniref:class I SAM-dependent DNA methyltransferase n=1 Tax=Xanthomonas euvesicatoria TaxID=456327 RepID=UPI001C43ADAC|nr:class I SAM-dependent DNA methyltransferase [Xanthomonas euvesicatoria]MBV6688964.1 type I restriction-modification system subunit M [Xanthomonas euvesicatoria pv. physalidis]
MNLSSTIKSIQDIMRKDDGVDGDAQRLGQLTWMLFLKVFDQREEEWEDDNAEYESPIPVSMRWRNWAAYVVGEDGKKKPQVAASEIVGFVNNELFPTLKGLDANADPQHKVIRKVIRSVFEDANNYMKSGTQFLAVIEKLEDAIQFRDFKTRANLGDVYEQLLNDLRGAGNAGEFYTPRAITQFMADRLNPSLAKRETVMDPACGTGGFLTAAIDYLRNQLPVNASAADKAAIEGLIRGIEKKQLPHLLCTTNMLLHGIDVPSQIEHRNTLGVGWDEWNANDKVDCIITNPPFGGYEDDGVGSDYPADLRTRETADMFVALIVKKLLKEDGRAAVVLPDGFLFGEGIKATLKKLLLENQFAWKVDFKGKREQAEAAAKPHWERAEQLGNEAAALDNRIRDLRESIKGLSDAKQRQPLEKEIEALRPQAENLRLQYRDAEAAADRLYWRIYNLDLKNPNAPEDESHDPDVLLDKYKTLLGKIQETENSLKSELAAALAHHFEGKEA